METLMPVGLKFGLTVAVSSSRKASALSTCVVVYGVRGASIIE